VNIHEEIIKHWKENGDYIRFKRLESDSYDMIRGQLVLYAYGRLKSWQDAEDAVQNAYVHTLTYPPIGDGHNFGGLYKLYLDQSIRLIRYGNMRRDSELEDETIEGDDETIIDKYPTSDLFPDQVLALVEQTNLLMDLSSALKPKAKAIVRLALIFGYSYREIGEITRSTMNHIDFVLGSFRDKVRGSSRYENLCRGS